MEFRHLRYFVMVAETGHMTRAAERLGIQQPPLSLQIRALEQQLGVRLLRRHPKGVDLTDEGQVFLMEARRLLADAEALQERMARVARGELGRLSVGFTSSAATHAFTPQTLRVCRRRYPELTLELSEANAAELTEALVAGRLHAAFVRAPVAQPPGVTMHTLLHEPMVLALPLDHALAADTTPLPLQALHEQPLILVRRPGAPGLYANLLALCARRGVQPRVVAEVERMLSNLNLVAAGVGLSVVPESMRGTHAHAIRYRPLETARELEAPLTLLVRQGEVQGALATFVSLVRELAATPEPA
ncbi:MAG: LysR family transcriptional regulator [Pseudomonadota bacterium]